MAAKTPDQTADAARLKAIFDKLKAEAKERGETLTQETLAEDLGWTQSTVNQYMLGYIKLNLRAAAQFAQRFGCSVGEFSPSLQEEIDNLARFASSERACTSPRRQIADSRSVHSTSAEQGARQIPLLSHKQVSSCAERSKKWLVTDQKLSSDAFALQVEGDAMLPEFREGDRVIIDPAIHPRPGDYVVAKNGDDVVFQKYRLRFTSQGEKFFELVPLNEDYPTMCSYSAKINVVGTMVEHRKIRR